jgi:hypothetical protein
VNRPPVTIADQIRTLRKINAIEAAEMIDHLADGAALSLLDHLGAEFGVSDKVALREAVETAAHSYEGSKCFDPEWKKWHGEHAAQLDALCNLGAVKWTLAAELARPGEPLEAAAERVDEMLAVLQAAARRARRGPRVGTTKRGRKTNAPLRSLVRALAGYWILELGRKFTADQNWGEGISGRQPHADAERFCFEVVRFLVPGAEDELRTIAREFSSRSYLRE